MQILSRGYFSVFHLRGRLYFGVNFSFLNKKRHPRNNSWMSVNVDIIVLINVLSAVVAIQSNIASLVFLGQLCIAYLYATKVARAILIAHRQFS